MREVNPIKFSRNLFDTYKRYLFSFVPIGVPDLKDLFWKAIDSGNHAIFKGPYVHCPPQYKKAHTPRHLMAGNIPPFLDKRLLKCDKDYFNPDRPLYTHQEEALKKLQEGRNIAVSTGTGSGKTESFLIPLLHDALQNPSPGVRAIIIYPMNALANDQLDRMRHLLKTIPEITFGRYTGETPRDDKEAKKQGYGLDSLPPNEQLTREKIRRNPPHILLTNFAMLEYLLLRPSDADIFSQKSVRYVVLDEAHTYTGAKSIDISMLLRRFKSLFPKNKLQFVLTSATISKDRSAVARFATDLCGVPFVESDIIFGEEDRLSTLVNSSQLDLSLFNGVAFTDEVLEKWCDALQDEDRLFDLINSSSLFKGKISKAAPNAMLFNALRSGTFINCIYKLDELCRERPVTIDQLAQEIFKSDLDEMKRIVTWLLLVGSHARADNNVPPLLPIKLHYFLRGLSGVHVCINSGCRGESRELTQSKWKAVFLEERETCKYCNSKVLSLSACMHCGLPVFKIYEKAEKWQTNEAPCGKTTGYLKRQGVFLPYSSPRQDHGEFQVKPGENNPKTHLLTFKFSAEDSEEAETLPDENESRLIRQLCLNCGSFQEGAGLFNCCDAPHIEELTVIPNEEGKAKSCPQCNGKAGRYESVFRDFITGDDAPTSVIAEGILRELPGDKSEKPAEGRSLIAFSDSRQRAAFFAPYLTRTTLDTAFQQPLITAIRKSTALNDGQPAAMDEIAGQYVAHVSQMPFLVMRQRVNETGDAFEIIPRRDVTRVVKSKLSRDVSTDLYRQICRSPRHRNSLFSLALAYVAVEFTEYEKQNIDTLIPELVAKDGGHADLSVIQVLLQIFLRRMAIDLPDWITPDMIIEERRRSARFHRTTSDASFADRLIHRWNPFVAPQDRRRRAINVSVPLKVLKKMFPSLSYDDKFYDDLLGRIWDVLTDSVLTDRGRGEYQLKSERILFGTKTKWHKCNTCGLITAYTIAGYCPLPDCQGKTILFDTHDIEELFSYNHFFERITKRDPLPIRVKEHTAQLNSETGRKYQEEFRSGDINVLSTSTTFELGIDIGQLKSVFLRNMPPTTSSYVQRSGRAGRRLDGTSFVVTFSRNAPHDQYFFNDPIKMASGRIAAPIINLKNDKLVQRHVNSFLMGKFLSSFFRDLSNRSLTVEWFFLGPDDADSPFQKYIFWISDNNEKLLKEVERILPANSPLMSGDSVKTSSKMICDAKLNNVDNEISTYAARHAELSLSLQTASGNARTGIAKGMEIIENLARQFRGQSLIDFLSGVSWLPSYAFPQDIVKLRVMQEKYADKMKLERDREYGITEYAPGAEIIADGKRFKSKGLVFYGQVPEIEKYRFCKECRRLYLLDEFTKEAHCESCGKRLGGRDGGDYLKPLGFTTSIGDPVLEPDLIRQLPPPSTDVFLLEWADSFQDHPIVKGVSYGFHKNGRLFKANRGYKAAGFKICQKCGLDLDNNQNREHKTPWGSKCQGQYRRLHLAHEFSTEILQLRFRSAPERWDTSFWLSLSEAFRNGVAETLEAEKRDIGVTFRGISETSGRGEIVLYDRVPGSAGYLGEAINKLPEILENILFLLKNCPCDIESSCYICLRSYDNQFHWEHLKRKPIVEWLEKFIS